MGSADFSQFVVTTANETACETSTLKVRALSPHPPATSTGTSSNFWTSSFLADLSVFPSLICGFCPSGQGFAFSFLQISPHGGHPCCSAMYFVVAYVYSGLSPVRARPWRANQKKPGTAFLPSRALLIIFCFLIRSFFPSPGSLRRGTPSPSRGPGYSALHTPPEGRSSHTLWCSRRSISGRQ